MKKQMRMSVILFVAVCLLVLVVSAASFAQSQNGASRRVPEPSTIALLGVGVVSLGLIARRMRNKK